MVHSLKPSALSLPAERRGFAGGTVRIPPRPFLGGSLAKNEEKLKDITAGASGPRL
jgi:hypothetical protein